MAETDWLGMLGGLVGSAAGAYAGTYAGNPQWGAQVGGAMGQSLGSATSQETGLTEGAGYDPNSMYGSYMSSMGGGGGGGGMGGMMDMFGGGGGGGGMGGGGMYRAPTMSTADLFGFAGNMLPQIAGYEGAYNLARQPDFTQSQLNAEQQIAPGVFDLRRDAIAARQRDLDLGYRLPPELQDLVLTNALQGLGSSGTGLSNMQMLFGARSLAGAGLDRGEARIANALQASQFNPNYYQPASPFGSTPGLTIAGDIRGEEAFQNNLNILNQQTQMAAQQKAQQSQANTNAFKSKLRESAAYVGGAGGGSSTIGGPQYGIGAGGGGSSGGFDWTRSFGRPSSVPAQGYPVGSDQYNAVMG